MGTCKDEFVDNNNWPYELYVREGRRMLGEFVMIQKDVISGDAENLIPSASALTGWMCTVCRVMPMKKGILKYEGGVQRTEQERMKHIPYQIPYRSIIPKEKTGIQSLRYRLCIREPCSSIPVFAWNHST